MSVRSPNYTAQLLTPGNATTSPSALSLTFAPSYLRVMNQGAADVYINFQSSAASTGDARLSTGEKLEIQSQQNIQTMGFFTTSTGAGGVAVDFLALG